VFTDLLNSLSLFIIIIIRGSVKKPPLGWTVATSIEGHCAGHFFFVLIFKSNEQSKLKR
jgi:hypothetical protein